MQRLKRVFHIDIERCGVCGGTLRVIACIETPELIERILTHLAARSTASINPPAHRRRVRPELNPGLPITERALTASTGAERSRYAHLLSPAT